MRSLIVALSLLFTALPLAAADDPATAVQLPAQNQRVELGAGIAMPSDVFTDMVARPDGLATLERMRTRAERARELEGVPHLIVLFIGMLLFFGSAMFYYHFKHKRLHQTIRLMVEKGVPLPAELLRAVENFESGADSAQTSASAATPTWASNVLWGGFLWITVGSVGMLYLWLRGNDKWPWGFAAVIYGVGAVISALVKRRSNS